jgi:YD repeat-containing protein
MMSRGTAMKLWRRSVSGALILLFGVQAAVPASAVPWQQSQPTQTVSIGSSRAPSFLRTTRPHPEVLRGVLPPPGILVQGPAMRRTPLQPQPVGTARLNNGQSLPKTLQLGPPPSATSIPSHSQTTVPSSNGSSQTLGIHSQSVLRPLTATPTPAPTGSPLGSTSAFTGIKAWWSYVGGRVGGVGAYQINVGDGNLALSSGDMSVANKGVALSFLRTYNSLSQHDYNGTDGSTPSNYGNGWTNSFDARIANLSGGGMSVYDGAGTRFDYTSDGHGNFIPPAGIYAQLTFDGGSGYYWTAKNGVQLYFYSPTMPGSCNCPALDGRLHEVYGRDSLNNIQFAYYFDNGNATSSAYLNKIVATAEDGRAATLLFANFGTYRLLSSLAWPDSTTVTYGYDSAAHLTQVSEPSNGSLGSSGTAPLIHQYNYTQGGLLQSVSTPIWVNTNGSSGAYVYYGYSVNNKVSNVYYTGVVNFIPSDGTSTLLQPSVASGVQTYRSISIAYNASTTALTDTDGHSTTYTLDSTGRVTQAQSATGSTTLTVAQGWYSAPDLRANNVAFTQDAREYANGTETDYAYDNNGNLIAAAAPTTTTSSGTFRPTTWFTYDAHNNLTGYCDPVTVHSHSGDWTATPSPTATLCPSGTTGSTQMGWIVPADGDEPSGQLTTVVRPSPAPGGYQYTIAYSNASQGGADYGLPTTVTGAQFTQTDGSNLTPSTTAIYDSHGNPICESNGTNKWRVNQYSTLGQLTATGDADDTALSGSACGKSGASYKTANYYFYYPDGQLKCTQTSPMVGTGTPGCYSGQGFGGGGSLVCSGSTGPDDVCYGYDADQNLTAIGGDTTSGATYTFDGDDRLVEAQLPADSTNDYYAEPWLTRYIYDLSQGNQVTVGEPTYGTASFLAHGNLYKAQRYLTAPILAGPLGTTYSWIDTTGSSYDAINRSVTSYFYQPGGYLESTTRTYDSTTSTLGLLATATTAVGDTFAMAYDPIGHVTGITSTTNPNGGSGDTPSKTLAYDPDGRLTSVATSAFGTQSYAYDVDGNLVTSTEPSGGSGTTQYPASGSPSSPATLTFGHYPNGWKSSTSVSSTALTQTNLETFTYRDDGELAQATLTYNGTSYPFTSAYTPGGRLNNRTDYYYPNTSSPAVMNTYDQYGRLQTYTVPQGQYSSIAFSNSGLLGSYKVVGQTATLTYTLRGELVGKTLGSTRQYPPSQNLKSADGYLYDPTQTQACTGSSQAENLVCVEGTSNFDERAAAPTGATVVGGPSELPTPAPTTVPYTYDAGGRLTTTRAWVFKKGTTIGSQTIATRQFDTENSEIGYNGTNTAWGPNRHPIMSNVSGANQTVHWEGGSILFVTDSSSRLIDLKFGLEGDITPLDSSYTGLTVWDRDLSGVQVSAHNGSGNNGPSKAAWMDAFPSLQGGETTLANASAGYKAPSTVAFAASRPDGYSFGDIIQGVRAYETADGIWTTPDLAVGNEYEPMSQLAYSYTNNNSAMFGDYTGLTSSTIQIPPVNFGAWCGGFLPATNQNGDTVGNVYVSALNPGPNVGPGGSPDYPDDSLTSIPGGDYSSIGPISGTTVRGVPPIVGGPRGLPRGYGAAAAAIRLAQRQEELIDCSVVGVSAVFVPALMSTGGTFLAVAGVRIAPEAPVAGVLISLTGIAEEAGTAYVGTILGNAAYNTCAPLSQGVTMNY